eukprot:GHUV01038099.1.p1 GENE.GHUV01038099.1~~GHUV01038099.1.p1  ORF type:complete len:124 (-),score=38.36 GHUV01038099.1:387-758(-)
MFAQQDCRCSARDGTATTAPHSDTLAAVHGTCQSAKGLQMQLTGQDKKGAAKCQQNTSTASNIPNSCDLLRQVTEVPASRAYTTRSRRGSRAQQQQHTLTPTAACAANAAAWSLYIAQFAAIS